MIRAVLHNELNQVAYVRHEIFNLQMPASCPGVPDYLLNPATTWNDQEAYAQQARKLADAFRKNMSQFENHAESELHLSVLQPQ